MATIPFGGRPSERDLAERCAAATRVHRGARLGERRSRGRGLAIAGAPRAVVGIPLSGYTKLEGKVVERYCCDPPCNACGGNPTCNSGPVNLTPGTIGIDSTWTYNRSANQIAAESSALPAIRVFTPSDDLPTVLFAYRQALGVPEAVFHCLEITSPGELSGLVIAIRVPPV